MINTETRVCYRPSLFTTTDYSQVISLRVMQECLRTPKQVIQIVLIGTLPLLENFVYNDPIRAGRLHEFGSPNLLKSDHINKINGCHLHFFGPGRPCYM